MYIIYILLIGLLHRQSETISNDKICTYQESYEEIINETLVKQYPKTYKPECNFWSSLWSFMTKKCNLKIKTEDRIEYRNETVRKTRTRFKCCDGWKDLERWNCTNPVCKPDCMHGTCVQPYECRCEHGWKGSICGDKCDGGTYGRDCSQTCNCGNGSVTCQHVTGECQCAPGFMGIKCQEVCPRGKFGFGCSEDCACAESSQCRSSDGFCNCSSKMTANSYIGYTGPTCSSPCNTGVNCLQTCDCIVNQGDCNPYTGLCICKPGFQGPRCQLICPLGTFGPNCLGRCLCLNNSTCNAVTGSCYCQPGWSGERCENPCQKGRYGVDCALTCDCLHFESCHPLTGMCSCSPGWSGSSCSDPCPAGTFGLGCSRSCNCSTLRASYPGQKFVYYATGEGAITFPDQTFNGLDDYFAVYNKNMNRIINFASPFTTPKVPLGRSDGIIISTPTTTGDEITLACDPLDGRCICPLGRTGSTCQDGCPEFKFGKDCDSDCDCDHASTCDHVTGACNCTLGWHGKRCEIACGKGFYGPNCEKTCECYGAETCHPITGACICPAGKTGINCSEDCSFGWYGIFCQHLCPCTLTNANLSQPCDMVTGKCNCQLRFGGNCSDCETGLFGSHCELACPCMDNAGRPATCDSSGQCKCPNGTYPDRCIVVQSNGLAEEMALDGRSNSPWMTLLFVIFSSILFIVLVIGLASCYIIRRRRNALRTHKMKVSEFIKKGALPSIPSSCRDGDMTSSYALSPRTTCSALDTSMYRRDPSSIVAHTDHFNDTSDNIYCMDDDDIEYAYPTSLFGTVDRKGSKPYQISSSPKKTRSPGSGHGDESKIDKVLMRAPIVPSQNVANGPSLTNRGHLYQELPGNASSASTTTTGPPSLRSSTDEKDNDAIDTTSTPPTVINYNETYLVPMPVATQDPDLKESILTQSPLHVRIGTAAIDKRNYHKLDHSGDSFKIIPPDLTKNYSKFCPLPLRSDRVEVIDNGHQVDGRDENDFTNLASRDYGIDASRDLPPPIPLRNFLTPMAPYPPKNRPLGDDGLQVNETFLVNSDNDGRSNILTTPPKIGGGREHSSSSHGHPNGSNRGPQQPTPSMSESDGSELYHFPTSPPNTSHGDGSRTLTPFNIYNGGRAAGSDGSKRPRTSPSPPLTYNTVVPPPALSKKSGPHPFEIVENKSSRDHVLNSDGYDDPKITSQSYEIEDYHHEYNVPRDTSISNLTTYDSQDPSHRGPDAAANSDATINISTFATVPNSLPRPIPPKKPSGLSNAPATTTTQPHRSSNPLNGSHHPSMAQDLSASFRLSSASSGTNYDEYDSPGNVRMA